MKFLSLDFEASNKDPRRGCPVQIGIALMDDGGIVFESDEWLIKVPKHYKTGKPMKEVDAYALAISGLTLDRIESEGLDSRESCDRLGVFVRTHKAENLPVLAFNFSFDNESYRDMLFSGGYFDKSVYPGVHRPHREVLSYKWLCASAISRRALDGKLDAFSLDDVAAYFDLKRDGENHSALADAILAGRVYSHLLAMEKA